MLEKLVMAAGGVTACLRVLPLLQKEGLKCDSVKELGDAVIHAVGDRWLRPLSIRASLGGGAKIVNMLASTDYLDDLMQGNDEFSVSVKDTDDLSNLVYSEHACKVILEQLINEVHISGC